MMFTVFDYTLLAILTFFFVYLFGDHLDLPVRTHSFPTRRSSDLYRFLLVAGRQGCRRGWERAVKFKLPWWLRMTRVLVAYYFTFIFLAGYALAGVLREKWGYVVLVAACEVTRTYFSAGSLGPRPLFRLWFDGEQQNRSRGP